MLTQAKHKAIKLFAVVLAAVMALVMCVGTAFASETSANKTITIKNPVVGSTYKVYKVFNATGDGTHISYSLVEGKEEAPAGFSVDLAGNVSYDGLGQDDELTADDIAAIANYVAGDDPVASQQASSEDPLSISVDSDGYYYVTTTTGTVVTIDSVNNSVTIEDKNEAPVVDKKVINTDDPDSAQVGDTVNFEITIHAKPGAENYVLHDNMSDGLTLTQDPIVVKDDEGLLSSSTDYSIAYPTGVGSDGCDFEITFTKDYLDSITAETNITVTYSAVLNANAVVDTNPETNEAILKYGANNHISSTPAETKTYTYDFDLTKTDENKQPLSGAEFSLYSQEEDGAAISLVDLGNGSYRVATSDDVTTTTTIAVNEDGKASVSGLAGKNYWLEETKAPNGYNMLTARERVTFNEGTDSASADFSVVTVVNKAGTELPSTGGMGTTIFYIVGGVLVAGAVVLLVTKRRMNASK